MPTCLHVDKRAALHAYTLACVHACSHQKTTQNPPKNLPKTSQNQAKRASKITLVGSWPPRGPKTPPRRSKTFPRRPFGGVLGASGASWAEKVAKMAPSWLPKTEPKSVLRRPGGVLGASWGHLGSVLGRLGRVLGRFSRHVILEAIFGWSFYAFSIEKSIPKTAKIMKLYCKNNHFLLSGDFNIRSFLCAIWKSTRLHFRFKNHPKSPLGGFLKHLSASCGRLGGVLGRLGTSW